MNQQILAISIGPVQGFIAAARRTRDLWTGSIILSEVARAVAKHLHGLRAELIFPAPAPADPGRDLRPIDVTSKSIEPQSEFDVTNVILVVLPDDVDAVTVVEEVRNVAHDRWRDFADEAFKASQEDIEAARWKEQLKDDDIIEFYAAWMPYTDEASYQQTRREVMRLLAGRKACRDFPPGQGHAGVPKSSLDGARESVLVPADKGQRDADRNGRRPSGLWARPGEQLDVVGVAKRAEYGHDSIRYVSVSRIAAHPWLHGVWTLAQQEQYSSVTMLFDELKKKCRELTRTGALRERGDKDKAKFPFLEEFPYEGTAVYRSRYREVLEDCPFKQDRSSGLTLEVFRTQLGEQLEGLRQTVRSLEELFGEPNPYFAVLVADGDRMGATLSCIRTSGEHQRFSRQQSEFALRVRGIVREHHGATVYAGADDVLAFVPLDQCLACARRLHDEFWCLMREVTPEYVVAQTGGTPTLSVGLAIGHFMEPLEDLLNYGRAAEKAAKGDDRNGLAIAVHPRGGAGFTVREQWQDGGRAGQSLDRRILRWAELFGRRQLPSKAAYDLRELSRNYETWSTTADDNRHALRQAIQRDALRLLRRKQGTREDEGAKAEIAALLGKVGDSDGLRRVAQELIIAQWISGALDQADGRRASQTEEASRND